MPTRELEPVHEYCRLTSPNTSYKVTGEKDILLSVLRVADKYHHKADGHGDDSCCCNYPISPNTSVEEYDELSCLWSTDEPSSDENRPSDIGVNFLRHA